MTGIIVDFNRPMPVFPVEGLVLLPHALQPLHIFRRRDRQMISHCLGEAEHGGGQIAMASFVPEPAHGTSSQRPPEAGAAWKSTMSGECEGEPAAEVRPRQLRPVVCVGHIVRHEELDDGRYNILLQGICRARILDVEEPDSDRLYHQVRLRPIGVEQVAEASVTYARTTLRAMLRGPQLSRMSNAKTVIGWIQRKEIPTAAVVEIASSALVFDEEMRYRLLAEPSLDGRVRLLREDLAKLACLVRRGDRQSWREWPKGMSWN